MHVRLVLGVVLLSALGCSSVQTPVPQVEVPVVQNCPFTIESEVDGVSIVGSDGSARISSEAGRIEFQLPCGPQTFELTKVCYPPARVTLVPGDGSQHTLRKRDWEKYGFLRVENGSTDGAIEVRNLPGGPLVVPSGEHASRKLPLGTYRMRVAARYKEPIVRDLELCAEDDLFNLRVDTEGPEGDLVAQDVLDVGLEHGTGAIRVITEDPNITFTLAPEQTPTLSRYLEKVAGKIGQVDLDQAPESLRRAVALLRRLDSESFKAPSAITLPAGKYFLTHNRQGEDDQPLELEVEPNEEARLLLP